MHLQLVDILGTFFVELLGAGLGRAPAQPVERGPALSAARRRARGSIGERGGDLCWRIAAWDGAR